MVGRRQGEEGVCVHVCVLPYLNYLCAGLRQEVLLVGIYDSHLDQSIGLPVSAWGHQIITGYTEEEREEGEERMEGKQEMSGKKGGEEDERWEGKIIL